MRLTIDQVERRKEKAVRFVEDVLGDSERAAEIEQESIEDYAERRGIEIIKENPHGRSNMHDNRTKAELIAENEELRAKLDNIADIAVDDEEGDLDDEEFDDDEDED